MMRQTKPTMNRMLTAGVLCALLYCSTAFAADGWSLTFEPEHERVQVRGGADFYSDSMASIFSYRQGMNRFDFKLETSKDHDASAATGGKVEVRYRRYFQKLVGLEPSLRVSLGKAYNSGGPDFPFFTIQPKFAYELANGWEPYVSVRFRDAFESSRHYQTTTTYVGVAVPLGHGWEIEPSVFSKSGNERSTGIELEITISFK